MICMTIKGIDCVNTEMMPTIMTTGETFRKKGKSDIHIMFENKAAFIGECKIWHGIKNFKEAVEQLFSYSTWRDTKTAIIVFKWTKKR